MPFSRSSAERMAALLLAGTSLVLVGTCVGTGRLESRPVRAPASTRVAPTASKPPPPPSAVSAERRDSLARFHRALTELGRGERKGHVRLFWLGDSHTAADYWPDAVRRRLTERFGSGGPGFVRVGVLPYRHAKLSEEVKGRWAHEPVPPSARARVGDGVFGLGGIRAVARGGDARARIELGSGAIRGGSKWDLAYRLSTSKARFRVALDGGVPRVVTADPPSGSTIQHLELTGSIDGSLVVDGAEGAPEFFGVTVESTQPGVVLDTVGIDGARVTTPLAWDEDAWIPEVRRRNPELAIVAFGTNEVLAPESPERFAADFRALVGRLRRAVPELDCMLIGPTPLEESGGRTHPRVVVIDQMEARTADELGCAYFSPFQAMGGEGGYSRWSAESPPLTARDRVHLSPAGYTRLGGLLADLLLRGLPASPQ